MISPKSHPEGDNWKINKVRLVLRLKDLYTRQKWSVSETEVDRAERAHFGRGLCAMAALSGQLSGSTSDQDACICSSRASHLSLALQRSPLSPAPPVPACGFVSHPVCIFMCTYDLSHLPEAFRESVFWHLTTDWKLGSDSNYLSPDWPCFHLLNSCKNGTFWEHWNVKVF